MTSSTTLGPCPVPQGLQLDRRICVGGGSTRSFPSPPTSKDTAGDAAHAEVAHSRSTATTIATATSWERGFCHVKQWRGPATRYDELALSFRGGAVLEAVVTWLRAVGDTP